MAIPEVVVFLTLLLFFVALGHFPFVTFLTLLEQ